MTQNRISLIFPLLLVCYEIATYLSNDMYLPALPTIMRDLGFDATQAQMTLGIWFIGQACFPLIIGALSDRYGRKPIVIGGGLIYALSSLICALATHPTVFMLGRFIEGGMVAALLVPGYASIHELFDHKAAIRVIAFMGSIAILAPALGPLFGGIILNYTSWRGIFWIITAWSFVNILLLAKWMPETHTKEKRLPIHVSQLCKHYSNLLINKRFMRYMFMLGLIFAGWIAWITASPLLIIQYFHYNPIEFGFIQMAIFATYIAGNRTIKFLLERVNTFTLIRIGQSIALSGGFLAAALAFLFPHSLFPFLAGMVIYSFGSAMCFAPLNRVIIESSNEPMGLRVALFEICLTACGALGSAAAGFYFNGSVETVGCLVALGITLSTGLNLLSRKKSTQEILASDFPQ